MTEVTSSGSSLASLNSSTGLSLASLISLKEMLTTLLNKTRTELVCVPLFKFLNSNYPEFNMKVITEYSNSIHQNVSVKETIAVLEDYKKRILEPAQKERDNKVETLTKILAELDVSIINAETALKKEASEHFKRLVG